MKRLALFSNLIAFYLLIGFDHWRQTTRRPASDVSFQRRLIISTRNKAAAFNLLLSALKSYSHFKTIPGCNQPAGILQI